MQYPFSANNNTNNADVARNNVKSNNPEHQQRDSKENNGDIDPTSSGRTCDTGKSDDISSNGTFAMSSVQSPRTQQSPYISEKANASDNYAIQYQQGMLTVNYV